MAWGFARVVCFFLSFFILQSRVTNLDGMFRSAIVFEREISNWDGSRVTNMYCDMFHVATLSKRNNSTGDVWRAMDMYVMFLGTPWCSREFSKWNVSRVTDKFCMFHGETVFSHDLSKWDVSAVPDMTRMFGGHIKCH